MEQIKDVILVDGAFILKRCKSVYKNTKGFDSGNVDHVIKYFKEITHKHAENKYLYRIFYYDYRPLEKKVHNPITKFLIPEKK